LRSAARAVFAERGYACASVEDITNRAGVAVGAFYLHYSSKRQLLVDLMNELVRLMEELRLNPPRDASVAGMRRSLHAFLWSALRTDRENYGVFRAWDEAIQGDPQLAAQDAKVRRWSDARVIAVFRELARHRAARPGVDIDGFGRIMNRHFWALLGQAAVMSPRAFRDEVRIASDVVWSYLFDVPTVRR
jgi:AcrR family transcriptional regulator